MDISTGEIYKNEKGLSIEDLAAEIGVAKEKLKEVKIPLTEKQERKMVIGKYDPCGCGSGKKFKFCCFKP